MQKHHSFRLKPLAAATSAALLVGFGAGAVRAADNLPDLGSSGGQDWRVDTFYENATHARRDVGLSKFRNTIQVEADKDFGGNGTFSSIKLRTKFRGTYDGVYKLNDDEYGKKAGGPIMLENGRPGYDYGPNIGAPAGIPFLQGTGPVAHGSGPMNYSNAVPLLTGAYSAPPPFGPGLPGPVAAALAASNNFVDAYPNNPNDGMIVLGSNLHKQGGGVAFGVPQAPCDYDSRGCIKDYMDANSHELASPEFNDRLDFIREAFVVAKLPMADGRSWNFQLGKQQVVWGRTDLFRVLDVINPVDYSRNNIYDELQDIRIPMWIFTAEYRMGATETFDDANVQFVWNFDKFRPNNLGQGGTPNQILGAGDFFRGMKNLWDNGGTVANFAGADPTGGLATNFGANQIGIRKAHMPEWSFANTQFGIKWEGVYKGTGFSLNALTFRSQLPSLRNLYSKGVTNVNPFIGAPFEPVSAYPWNIAFDIYFPRVNLIGGSMDMQLEEIKSSLRLETALTKGEEFANTAKPGLYSESKVWRYVIGLDRPTFIPFLNEGRAFLLSAQLFGQHLLDHEEHRGPWGKYGMPDHEHNHIATFLMKGWYQNDRVSPQIIMAHDFEAHSSVAAPSLEWLYSDDLKITVGANVKFGDGAQKWNDARDGNPFPPYSGAQGGRNPMAQGMVGLTGYEPLGRFRAGPIGMANKEDEVFVTVRYKF